jgi:transposase
MANRGKTACGETILPEVGMDETLKKRIIGVDSGEEEHSMVVLKGDGTAGAWQSVGNSCVEVRKALESLRREMPRGTTLQLVVDSRRSLNAVVVRVAIELGLEVWQVNPVAVERFREVEGQPRKDDDKDAFLNARMRYMGAKGCRLLADPRPEEIQLCRLTRLHTRLIEQRTTALNRIRSCLVELSPEVLRKDWEGPMWKSPGMRAVLQRWPAFDGLDRARPSSIEQVLRKAGSRRPVDVQARVLKEVAKRIHLTEGEREIMSLELKVLVDEVRWLNESLTDIDHRIRKQVLEHPIARKLLDMPGVGPFVAAVLIGELLPLARNLTEAEAATYAGLTPLSRKSGKGGKRPRLARKVNKRLTHALYLSAVSARKGSVLDATYYTKQVENHVGHPVPHIVANIALARQRFKVMYKLLTSDAVYDKEILIASHLDRRGRASAVHHQSHAA